ncbi:MAG: metal ABC transporter ATP-binding protein [Candidatus Bipolaricaulia bacterium]
MMSRGRAVEVIEVRDLSVRLDGRSVLKEIRFTISPGEFVGIIGPNGAGKTTLLKTILGLVKPERGEVCIFGKPVGKLGRDRRKIGYVPQRDRSDERFPLSVVDVVMLGRLHHMGLPWFFSKADRRAAHESLRWVDMEDYQSRPIGELSGGERQRVSLARALCRETELLLLDEPTVGLDAPTQKRFYRVVRRLRQELGLTIVAVSHDLSAIAAQADEFICINRSIYISGPPEQVLHDEKLTEAYRGEFDLFQAEGER